MPKITIKQKRNHLKASEVYVDVRFEYEGGMVCESSVPIVYRRTATEIEDDQVAAYLEKVYAEIHPSKRQRWNEEQREFWKTKANAGVTKAFFDALSRSFSWCCVSCNLPANPNWARRIQDLKEFGYTLSTNTSRPCSRCNRNTTQILLLPIKRGGITGYESWSPQLRTKIINILGSFDVFEAKMGRKEALLPDHKFPEIRWDGETKRSSLESLSDDEIKRDFQLLSNQRNQQKREVCRQCFQTNTRGVIYGIPYFYAGSELWDPEIPKSGKSAEAGCVGCAWYDIEKWRAELIRSLAFLREKKR